MARSRNRMQLRVDENVTVKLRQVQNGLNGREISRIMYAGAAVMGGPAKAAAPVGATGNLRAGVYVASDYKNDYVQLNRGGRRLNSPLKFPPRKRQALAVASTYYTRFVEGGRKPRSADKDRARAHERRGVGKMRKRPFFMRTVRRWRRNAEAVVERQLVRLIEREWQR